MKVDSIAEALALALYWLEDENESAGARLERLRRDWLEHGQGLPFADWCLKEEREACQQVRVALGAVGEASRAS